MTQRHASTTDNGDGTHNENKAYFWCSVAAKVTLDYFNLAGNGNSYTHNQPGPKLDPLWQGVQDWSVCYLDLHLDSSLNNQSWILFLNNVQRSTLVHQNTAYSYLKPKQPKLT